MKFVSKFKYIIILTILAAWMCAFGLAFAQDGGLPQRADIEDKYKWKVEDMYATIDAWEADFAKLEGAIGNFDQFKGHLGDSPQMLLNCLTLSDELDIIVSNLYVFAYLKLDEDNSQSMYQELGGRLAGLNARLGQAQSFISPEILSIEPSKLMSFVDEEKGLEQYRFYFEDMLRQQEHILSPEEEKILALAGPMGRAPLDIFQMIDNADHKLGTVADSAGNPLSLTYGRYLQILKGRDREARIDSR